MNTVVPGAQIATRSEAMVSSDGTVEPSGLSKALSLYSAYSWRGRIGLIVPSTNTTLEPEFARMAPEGVGVVDVAVFARVKFSRAHRWIWSPPFRKSRSCDGVSMTVHASVLDSKSARLSAFENRDCGFSSAGITRMGRVPPGFVPAS